MMKAVGFMIVLAFAASGAQAQDRGYCTAKCGGRPGGEAANPPGVVACFRQCMGATGNSDGVSKKKL